MAKTIYYLIILFLGFILVYISPLSLNYEAYVTLGNILFWSSLLLLLIRKLLRRVFTYLGKHLNKMSITILVSYLSVHYFVYSIALEKLLTNFYGEIFYVSSPFFSASITPFYPPSIYTTFINLLFNPTITTGFPPNFYIELSAYSIVLGFIIGSIVTATIMRVLEIGKTIKIKAILIAPILGVIAGGSCCISLPILLASVIPAANVLFFLPIGNTALFLAYILLPPLTALGLAFHYNSLFPKTPKDFRLSLLSQGKNNNI
ncbi:hypothetical protein SJAV_07320 [Sulfurisphaera javensis]|uniref:Uncharacterized protein n=1 Tax=Sulfurisphaera javensis TaxID=2049879 RepID=A0AAT9GPM4_9CREN